MPANIMVEDFPGYLDRMWGRFTGVNLRTTWERDVSPKLRQAFETNYFIASAARFFSWPPRKDKTKTHPLLILTGAMRRATIDKGGSGHIEQYDDWGMAIGVDASAIPYAATHQFGDPSRNIPARTFVIVNEETLILIEKDVADGVFGVL